jgi:hypothetical protein
MKLRIKGNSIRLRVMRSEVSMLIGQGQVEETVYFSADDHSHLTYGLGCDAAVKSPQVRYERCEIVVILPIDHATAWAKSDQVGIYATIDLGLHGTLDLIVEKDFACMDLSDADDLDTFPNPKAIR